MTIRIAGPRTILALVALMAAPHAMARDRAGKEAPRVDAVPAATEADPQAEATDPPNSDTPAVDAPASELWQLANGLEGEAAAPEVEAAAEEHAEERLAEMAITDELTSVDVPVDFYADPTKALKVDPLHLDEIDPSEFDIPIAVNDDVIKWMKYFTGSGRKYYARWLSRSTRYRPIEYAVLEKKGQPRDLVYLSMIESGYNTHAYSSADAAGLWQFIPSTGKMYDLRIDYWIDERRDPALASEAGVQFLSDLHDQFGDWYLAWAAYNGGPGRVRSATRNAHTTDFWTITKGSYLASETENYVPKIIAAAIIGHHPERYGFTGISYQDELVYDESEVPGNVDLSVLAKCAGITLEEFQEINPALRRYSTPPEGYVVRLPKGSEEAFVAALAEVPARERVATTEHRVSRGETLAIIARRYDSTAYDIAKANHLRDMDVIRVGQVLVIPGSGRGEAVAAASPAREETVVASTEPRTEAAPAPVVKKVNRYHTVRSGDNLTEIANRYGTSVSQLKSWNGMRSDTIYVGQRIKVGTTTSTSSSSSSTAVASASSSSSGSSSSTKSSTTSSSTSSSGTKTKYTVKRGDTLTEIASNYGVAASDVQKWNHIRNPSDIMAGQQLVLYIRDSGWTKYTVARGDSLGAIATRYHCTVTELKSWNALSTTVIQPGQVLKIKK